MKTTKWIAAGLMTLAAVVNGVGHAQGTADSFTSINLAALSDQASVLPLSGTNMTSLRKWSDSQLTVLVGALGEVPTIPFADLPTNRLGMTMGGTFWSTSQPGVPYPADTAGVDLWRMADGSDLMNDLNVDYTALAASRMGIGAMDSRNSGLIGFGDNGGTYTPDGVTNTPISYGTNLWLSIAQTSVATGNMSGIISNTEADVELELQYTFDLTQPWRSANWIVYGSESTNWTPWNVPAISSSNLFLRVKSWGVDANGLPLWWEQQYGLTNVDPNALDSAGDGWTIYQKYELGVAPNVWVTPAAPQGVTVNFNQNALCASLKWLPCAGNIAGYTVQKSYQAIAGGSVQITDYTVSSGATYQDNLSGNAADVRNGNAYHIWYQVWANYTNGDQSSWSVSIPLQQPTVQAAITPGASGLSTVVALGVPTSAALVRLEFIDENAVSHNDTTFDYNGNTPVSSIINGQYPLPTSWIPPTNDAYGSASYALFAQTIDASGNPSAPTPVTTNWTVTPFQDGRVQMKQNLSFQLRAAPMNWSFAFDF